jgi:hypothetical protein
MSILTGGGEIGALTPSDNNVYETTGAISGTGNTSYDSNFARCSTSIVSDASYAETSDIGSGLTTAFARFDLGIMAGGFGGARTLVVWNDDSGTARVRLVYTIGTNILALQYDVGAGWVQAGSTISIVLTTRQTFVLECNVNSGTGSLKLYVAGTERITSGSLNLAAITELNQLRFYGWEFAGGANTGITYVSQVLIGNESLIGMAVMTDPASGSGSNTAWTSDYTSIDETVYSDSDFIFSATNGQRETFAGTPVGSLLGYTPRALIVTARAKRGSSGPANLQLTVVSGAATSDTASIALGLGYSANVGVWEDDPNTTLDWTSSAIIAAQFGVEANT